VFWGASILHEAITFPILAGMAVILLGVFLTSRQRSRRAMAPGKDRPLPEISSGTGRISR
jgi:drug/metabolite transporter (DMT)-like permease